MSPRELFKYCYFGILDDFICDFQVPNVSSEIKTSTASHSNLPFGKNKRPLVLTDQHM